jgi:hypothetical protein
VQKNIKPSPLSDKKQRSRKLKLEEPWFSPDASKQLGALKPVFKKLQSVHERYIAFETYHGKDDDCGFWYRERPHIGFLAAAIWLADGIALEEYGTHKIIERERKRGRADLYFRIAKQSFYCEAKHLTLTLGKDTVALSRKVCAKLKKQPVDSRYCKLGYVLALCFVTVRVADKPNKMRRELLILINDLKESLIQDNCCKGLFWIGTKKRQSFKAKDYKYLGFFFAIRTVKIAAAKDKLSGGRKLRIGR